MRGQGKPARHKDQPRPRRRRVHMQSDFEMAQRRHHAAQSRLQCSRRRHPAQGNLRPRVAAALGFTGLARKCRPPSPKWSAAGRASCSSLPTASSRKMARAQKSRSTSPAPTRIPNSASTSRGCRTPIRNAPTNSRRNEAGHALSLLPCPLPHRNALSARFTC